MLFQKKLDLGRGCTAEAMAGALRSLRAVADGSEIPRWHVRCVPRVCGFVALCQRRMQEAGRWRRVTMVASGGVPVGGFGRGCNFCCRTRARHREVAVCSRGTAPRRAHGDNRDTTNTHEETRA